LQHDWESCTAGGSCTPIGYPLTCIAGCFAEKEYGGYAWSEFKDEAYKAALKKVTNQAQKDLCKKWKLWSDLQEMGNEILECTNQCTQDK
jgi:hypothetical protein